jgi:2-polyprenyl-3-methyl-5-hydroxy-6-metoxy-1,4-benzoquinol methylase
MSENKEIEHFYDGFSKQQDKVGINIRHYSIVNKLIGLGMKSSSNVLEAGCGVGTITQLLAAKIKSGKITAFDLSPEGVEITKSRVKNQKNIRVFKSDLLGFQSDELFDFIVFADVLEHIPSDELMHSVQHIMKFTKQEAKIVINIPDPAMNDYLRNNHPDKLQIIDNSVFAEDLMLAFANSGFRLVKFERYSLHHLEADYNFIVMQKRPAYKAMNDKKPLSIILKKTFERIKYLIS